MKNKSAPYIHQRIPEIEKYANTDEWIEGTLIEQDIEKVNVDNVMKDLEKILDLDSFAQVPRSEVGPSSAGIIQQELQENIAVSSKGKEKEVDTQVKETFTMTKQPKTFKG